jgi:allantoin racemase
VTKIRLIVLNCNVSESISAVIDAAAKSAAANETEVITLTPSWGVASAEGYLDSQLAAVGMLDAIRHYDASYDAVVLAGFGEAGLQAFREYLDTPVVDITDAAAHLALLVAPRYGVLTSLSRTIVQIQDSLRNAGIFEHCMGIRAIELPVLELGSAAPMLPGPLIWQARRLVEEGAEALILGCAGLAGMDRALSEELGVPVIDPVAAGVVLAESLVQLGLRTSKILTYAPPLDKPRPGWDPVPPGSLTGD